MLVRIGGLVWYKGCGWVGEAGGCGVCSGIWVRMREEDWW